MMNPEHFSEEIRNQLSQNAMQLMLTLYSNFSRLAEQEQIDMSKIPNQQMVLSIFWIALTGLAEHFSGERQNLYGHDMTTIAQFFFNTLVSGLHQQISST
ncbi:hypothetical protein [uncultured Acinetobacter sp.]|uniref:hypothetical protein n=1 Tax=uncultured Acinetobacter sp. TaxID=165433 RepID=UPI00258B3D08|nr:hypothetical protein [uncultured Acinetobacter sp.]